MAARTIFDKERQARYLEILAEGKTATHAAKQVAVHLQTVYQKRRRDPEFAAAYDLARKMGTHAMEDEAIRRAVEGNNKGIYWKGERVAYEKEYSDTLLMFMLKAREPEKYRERQDIHHSGEIGGIASRIADARARRLATLAGEDQATDVVTDDDDLLA